MGKKKNILMFSLLTLVVFATLMGVTYSYLAIRFSGLEEESTVKIGMGTMTIRFEDNSGYLSLSKVIPGASVTKEFSLYGVNDTKINNNVTDNNMYYEIQIIVDENTFSKNSITYTLESVDTGASGKLISKQTGFINSDDVKIVEQGYFSTSTEAVTHKYKLTVEFPETGVDQSEDMLKNIGIHINVVGASKIYAADYITKLYENDNDFNTGLIKDDTIFENIRYVSALNDENDESTRKEPNNYVSFNNDLWRIIGVFTVYDSGERQTVKSLKIVKDIPLQHSFCTLNDDCDTWEETPLSYYLSEEIYSNYLSEYYKYFVMPAKWYTSYTGDASNNKNLSDFYDNEIFGNQIYNKSYSFHEWYGGLIGLPSASDLMYISNYNKYSSESFENLTTEVTINNNWLIKNSETHMYDENGCVVYTMSFLDDRYKWVWYGDYADEYNEYVDDLGSITYFTSIDLEMLGEIYPTLYLENDVKIIGGTGTSDDPYQLGL